MSLERRRLSWRIRANLINDVDIAEMWKHLEFLCDIDRTSGTEGEYKSVRYIAEILKSYGIEVKINEFMAYLSHPKWAQIQTVDGRIIEAKTRLSLKPLQKKE